MTTIPPEQSGARRGVAVFLLALLYLLLCSPIAGHALAAPPADPDPITLWAGRTVRAIRFEGESAARLAYLQDHLSQTVGSPLVPAKVADSLRTVYATGLLNSADVLVEPQSDGVALIFRGTPRMFIGNVTVAGAKGATVNTQLERGARLNPGTRFTETKLKAAEDLMRQILTQNGYYEPSISFKLTPHAKEQLSDIAFTVVSGPHARVGSVQVNGESGLTMEEFRRQAHLRPGALVDQETVNRALSGLLKYYRHHQRLEAEIKLEAQTYAGHRVDYRFTANQGPQVKVVVTGASLDEDRIRRLIPVFEEGSVDDDLLNEGNRRVRDYFQSIGYFGVKVEHAVTNPYPNAVLISYNVQLGQRGHVQSVSVTGNHYFDAGTLKQLLSVHPAGAADRHGDYSQALVTADVNALQAVYQNNGFSQAKITPEVRTDAEPAATPPGPATPQGPAGPQVPAGKAAAARGTAQDGAPLSVVYHIDEGEQQRVGTVRIDGNQHVPTDKLLALLNTEAGQLLSPRNLAGDRDTLVTDYMGRGFDRVMVTVDEQNDPASPSTVNVLFHVAEGPQMFVRNVLFTGLHYTRPDTVARAITLHAGDPLSQNALDETQRNLYEFALFNEVNAAIQNPGGAEAEKTVLLQAVEARRWTLTYGAGFEVQTGTPVNGCKGLLASGVSCTPSGRTGISPRGLLAITRNGLFGREQSVSVQANYGLLEQKVDLIYQNPHFRFNRNVGFTFTGGYANSQDVTTYVASRLEAGFRLTQSFNRPGMLSRANTFVYGFDFRRVKVAEDSLEVYPSLVPTLAAAVTVGGPSFTWIRDTRDSAVDSHRGTYTSFQEFFSAAPFGAQAEFNRIDTSNSSYYGFDKNRFVLARNTRYGQERAFGSGSTDLLPLPERLYAGGATSLRGFSINAAGPRDPETGYPIGGAGAFVNNTELRLPPPTLPYFGDTVSFVLFHDMGNIFNNSGDVWPSLLRLHQPDRDSCKVLNSPPDPNPQPGGPVTSTGPHGDCSFNYFTHTPGVGVRYHTPVGPIRLDFSYNLNPPIYPININYSLNTPDSQPHVGEASHFNFFFSLGQTF